MRLNVHRLGTAGARPLLAIHGVTGHGLRFRDFVELAAPDRDVFAVDLRGHGRSGWEPPWDVITHLDDILETLEAEGLDESIDVMGHSFGGLLALSLVALAPELVQRAVLIDPAIALPAEYCADRARDTIASTGWDSPEAAIADRKTSVAESGHRFIAGEVEEHVVLGDDGRWRPRCSPAAAVTAWSEMAHAAPPIEEVRPVLILRAARDNYVQEETLLVPLREALGDELEVVDIDSAHMIYWEQPEAAAAVLRALQTQPVAAAAARGDQAREEEAFVAQRVERRGVRARKVDVGVERARLPRLFRPQHPFDARGIELAREVDECDVTRRGVLQLFRQLEGLCATCGREGVARFGGKALDDLRIALGCRAADGRLLNERHDRVEQRPTSGRGCTRVGLGLCHRGRRSADQ